MSEYNATVEDPSLHALGQEHLSKCRACCQRTASHHLGLGAPLEDVQIQQQSEISLNVLDNIQQITKKLVTMMDNLDSQIKQVQQGSLTLRWKVGGILAIAVSFFSGLIFH